MLKSSEMFGKMLSRHAFWKAVNALKILCGRGSAPEHAGELQRSLAGFRGTGVREGEGRGEEGKREEEGTMRREGSGGDSQRKILATDFIRASIISCRGKMSNPLTSWRIPPGLKLIIIVRQVLWLTTAWSLWNKSLCTAHKFVYIYKYVPVLTHAGTALIPACERACNHALIA